MADSSSVVTQRSYLKPRDQLNTEVAVSEPLQSLPEEPSLTGTLSCCATGKHLRRLRSLQIKQTRRKISFVQSSSPEVTQASSSRAR